MWSITIKMMKKNMKMLIPAGIAIMIGTAFIACTFLFGNTLNDTLRTQLTAQYAQANYIIQSTSKMSGSGSIPPTIGEVNTKQIASTDGVKSTYIQQNIPVNASTGDNSATLLAINASSDDRLLPVTMVKGHQPTGNKQIALPAKLADQLSVNIGDKVTLAANYGSGMRGSNSVELTVSGFTEDAKGAFGAYGGAAVISMQTLANLEGADSESDLMFTGMTLDIDEPKADTAVASIKKELPNGYSIETRQKAGDEALKALSQSGTNAVTVFLMCFGILAMFVAALVIANTFQVLVAQRRRTLALLRTIGAQKGQLYRSVIGEAGILGVIASILGIPFGSAIMAIVVHSHALKSLGMTGGLVFTWQVFVIPLAFGVIMTVLASIGSARSATRVTPLEALRPIEVSDNKRAGIARGVIGFLLITLGLVLTVGAVMMLRSSMSSSNLSDDYPTMLLSAIAGCALIFIGLVVTAAFWMPLLMRLGGAFAALFGPAAKIAHANIQKNPRRVASTGVALLIGVTLVSCIGTGAACAKQTMNNTLDTHYSVDMIAKGSTLSQSVADKIGKIDGVTTTLYAPIARGSVIIEGEERSATLIGVPDTATLSKVLHANLSGVSLDEGKALAPTYSSFTGKVFSFKNDEVSFSASHDDGSDGASDANTLTYIVTQRDYRNVDPDVIVTLFVNESYFQNKQVQADGHIVLAAVDTSKASAVDILTNAQTAIGTSAGASLSGPIAERVRWNQIVDTMLMLLVALLAVAVLIALIGVANTLSLSVIERTRESATLRAIGMTRGQLRWSLAVESLVISLVAGIAGEILGIAFGWVGSYMVFSPYGKVAFISEWKLDLIVLVVAAAAALLASVFPARRAVKTPPVEALAEA